MTIRTFAQNRLDDGARLRRFEGVDALVILQPAVVRHHDLQWVFVFLLDCAHRFWFPQLPLLGLSPIGDSGAVRLAGVEGVIDASEILTAIARTIECVECCMRELVDAHLVSKFVEMPAFLVLVAQVYRPWYCLHIRLLFDLSRWTDMLERSLMLLELLYHNFLHVVGNICLILLYRKPVVKVS